MTKAELMAENGQLRALLAEAHADGFRAHEENRRLKSELVARSAGRFAHKLPSRFATAREEAMRSGRCTRVAA